MQAQQHRDIGERRETDDRERVGALDESAAQQLDGVTRLGHAARGRQTEVGQAVGAVDGGGMLRRLEQRPVSPGGDGDGRRPRRIQHPKGVLDHLGERCVAARAADRAHVEGLVPHGQQNRQGIVDTGVDVEDHRLRHGRVSDHRLRVRSANQNRAATMTSVAAMSSPVVGSNST